MSDKSTSLLKQEVFTYKNTLGKELKSVLYYPVNYDSTKKYPMIVNIYQIQVEGATVSTTPVNTLATSDFSQKLSAKAYSTGNKVYLSNLSGKSTEVKVYSSTGALVKSLKTSTDKNFDVNERGLYFVNLKSEAGEKSIKVLVK